MGGDWSLHSRTQLGDGDADSDEARTLSPLHDAACTYSVALRHRTGQKALMQPNAMPRDAGF